jgi:Reverse transcriptase (RNA-dependent DNA polymerase)
LISETLNRLSGAKRFTRLDLRDAYHRIRIKRGDEWKTAFRSRYGHFEYIVMPFSLTNASASFQAYINSALMGLLDIICITYIDDIMMYSEKVEEHISHVLKVLERLK